MPVFKVTHVGPDLRRRQQRVPAPRRVVAMAWMEQLYGLALVIAAIRLDGEAP